MASYKDPEVCVLKALVEKNSSLASFELGLDQLGQGQELSLECLHAYAAPPSNYRGESSASSQTWTMEVEVKYEPIMHLRLHVVEITPASDVTVEDFVGMANGIMKTEVNQKYDIFTEKASFNVQRHRAVLTLPGFAQAKFQDLDFLSASGLYPLEDSLTVKAKESEGSVIFSSASKLHPQFLLVGRAVDTSKQAFNPTGKEKRPITIDIMPSEKSSTASFTNASLPNGSSIEKMKDWVNLAIDNCLAQLGIKKGLLVCSSSGGSLRLLANQDKGSLPVTISIKLGSKLAEALHEDIDTFHFHFGLPRFEAFSRGLEAEHNLGRWRAAPTKTTIPWSDPLASIAPFYLVSDGQDGGSFLANAGNVSVVALIGKSLRVQLSNPIRTRGRAGRLSLRFLTNEMRECLFSRSFDFFLVFRMAGLN